MATNAIERGDDRPPRRPDTSLLSLLYIALGMALCVAGWFLLPGLLTFPATSVRTLPTANVAPRAIPAAPAPAFSVPTVAPIAPVVAPVISQDAPQATPPPLYQPVVAPAVPNVAPSLPADNPGYSPAVEPGCDAACADASAALAAELKADQARNVTIDPASDVEATPPPLYQYVRRDANVAPSQPGDNPGFTSDVEPGSTRP